MTDQFDEVLAVALFGRAQNAPSTAGFSDVRRRARRRRQRRSALVALPTLVGASALARWPRSDDSQQVVGASLTATESSSLLSAPPASWPGFRCSDAGMLAGDVDAWLYFQGCEAWDVANVFAATATLTTVGATSTTWTGPSTAAVGFLNASSVGGIAGSITYSRFGAGEPQNSPIKSDTSFVMYSDPMDAPTASAVANDLGIPVRSSLDLAYVGEQTPIAIFVVIGEDLAAQFAAVAVTSDPPTGQPVAGASMRCWDPSEVEGDDPGYRYFTTCEPNRSADPLETTVVGPPATEPLVITASTALGCTAGHATVAIGETPSMIATRYDISVAELDAANVETAGYSTWVVGLVVVIPCPAAN